MRASLMLLLLQRNDWPVPGNLCANGDFETDLTGWALAGATTATRITTEHKFGSACMELVLPAAAFAGEEFSTVPLTSGTIYTFSCWGKGTAGKSFRFVAYTNVTGQVTGTWAGGWQKLQFTATASGTGGAILRLDSNDVGDAQTCYIDGVAVR